MAQELEFRQATHLEVRHPERIIDMIAAPYNEPTEVFLHRQNRWVTEEFDPQAFTGVTGDVTVNRAHDLERPLGRVVKFHPGDARGLRTELRISKTSEGDDILELANDGLLSASVGFGIHPGGEQWNQDRSARRILKAFLGHIGLTGDPAYTGAKVLAVRSAAGVIEDPEPVVSRTPNLDRILLERRARAAGMTMP